MSQAKVDRYKKDKSNRVKQAEHEKLMYRLEMSGAALVLALLIGWFSFSVYQNRAAAAEEARPATSTTMNVTEMQDYLADIQEKAAE